METDKSLLIWRQQEAQRILDEVRNHLDVPRVRRRLGRTGDELYQIALAAEAPEVHTDGTISGVKGLQDTETVSVVIASSDTELVYPAVARTPLQRDRMRHFIAENGISDSFANDVEIVGLNRPTCCTIHSGAAGETHHVYGWAYSHGDDWLNVSNRPFVLLNAEYLGQEAIETLVHEFSHVNDGLREPLRLSDPKKLDRECELRANSAEVRAFRDNKKSETNEIPREIERVRWWHNGLARGKRAFTPTVALERALARKGLIPVLDWTQDNEAIDE